MNHPKLEDWAPYVFGESTREARSQLAEHLQACPECAAQIAGWQRTLQKLDRWKLRAPRARGSRRPGSFVKWAIAAALVLGAGFCLGRLSATLTADSKVMRTEMEASIRFSLASDLQAALSAARDQMAGEWQARMNNALAEAGNASAAETRREFGELAQTFSSAREEDRRTLLALLNKIQSQHSADYFSLRSDLETVASLTEEEIRRAGQSLMQLAANKSSEQP